MNAEKAVFQTLNLDSGVSSVFSGRVYPIALPEDCQYPSAVYQRVSTVPLQGIRSDTGWADVRVQVTVYAKGHFDALSAAKVVRAAFPRGPSSPGGVVVDDIRFDAQRDLVDQQLAQLDLSAVALDFILTLPE